MSDDIEDEAAQSRDVELAGVSADEAAEAAELVRLLAGKSAVALSDDTLDGVGLMRLAHDAELAPEAFARIESEVLAGRGEPLAPTSDVTWSKIWWWLLAAVVPAVAGMFLVLTESAERPQVAATSSRQLPAPDVKVLEAQASWVTSDAQRPTFEREMRDYRLQVLASLDTP